jgi:hypothetical protein
MVMETVLLVAGGAGNLNQTCAGALPPASILTSLLLLFWIARTGVAWRDLHEHSASGHRLPPDTALDAVRLVGVAARSLQRKRGRQPQPTDDRQHNNPGAPLFSRR